MRHNLWASIAVLTCFVGMFGPGPATAGRASIARVSITAYPEPHLSDETMASQYDLVILQNWSAARARHLKQLSPNVKVLFYRAPQITWEWQENWAEINAHETWFLHSRSNQRVKSTDGDPFYLMDIRNAQLRAYQIGYIMKFIKQYEFDGLFWDGPPPTMELMNLNAHPGVSTWHEDARTFLREMKQALSSKLLIANSTQSCNCGDDTDFLPYVDGTMLEGFAHPPFFSSSQSIDSSTWTWQFQMVQRNISAGKYLLALSGINDPSGAPKDQVKRWQIFTYASYLLAANGTKAFYQWMYVNFDNFFPEMSLPIGTPLGAAYVTGAAYQRDFTGGKVVVNPSSTTRSIDLQGKYRLRDLSVTQITLQPGTATILIR